ncbi:MAG: periplasmic binding protein/LacI transcriptional regulator [Clostridia bacterium]|jgi:ribose transport system substrate-binding protein|nr:periplasmic binding protein/LacI transcriptional regulator [Clostridia bacterium]
MKEGWNMRKLIILGVFLLLGIQVDAKGMSRLAMQQEPTETPQIYIAVISKGIQTRIWEPTRIGAEQAAKDYGASITFEGPPVEESLEGQFKLFEEALNNNAQAIVISAVDSKVISPYLQKAAQKGIPVISFYSGTDSPIVQTTVGIDNYAAGELAAHKLAQSINNEGKVAILAQDPTSRAAIDRRDSFLDVLQQQYPNIQIVAIEYGVGDVDRSQEITKKITKEHPDIKGIFASTERTTMGTINAIRELNKEGEIKIVGFDSGKQLIDAVREGIMEGAITQNPTATGYKAVEAAIKAYKGERNPEYIDTGFAWYDKSNIDDPQIKQLLYE